MKKYFVTGIVILLPLTLTFAVLNFVFNILTEPFLGITKTLLARYDLLGSTFLFFSPDQTLTLASQVLILILLFLSTLLLGVIARWFLIYYLIRTWEYIIHKIPLVSTIYKTFQDIIKTFFSNNTSAFKQVVLVPFPNPETKSIGLLTCEHVEGIGDNSEEMIAVFIPTTPNPTSGFLVMAKKSSVIPLDMSVEDAFKYIISCGVVNSHLKASKVEPIAESLSTTTESLCS